MKKLRVAIMSSFNVDLLARPLAKAVGAVGLDGELHFGPYGRWQGELLDGESQLCRFAPDATFVFVEAEDALPTLAAAAVPLQLAEAEAKGCEAWARTQEAVAALLRHSRGDVFVHTMIAPPASALGILESNGGYTHAASIDAYNRALRAYAASEPRVHVFNYDALVAAHGYTRWHDRRLWHVGRMRLASSALALLAGDYAKYLAALHTPRRKCLVLDLDNTLWGGVLGEDGLGGIQISHSGVGLAFREFQLAILSLYRRGIILAIASKNNHDEAVQAIQTHPDMVLRPEHFAAMEIHWSEKSESIKRIAERLNIGLDSLVFWDDNHVERGIVRSQVPDVLVPEVPADPSDYVQFLRATECFETLTLTAEDQRRGQMYRDQVQRDDFLARAESVGESRSLDDYYASLEMQVVIERASDVSIPRIAQLTQRTNQFNLTTRRYSEAEVRARATDPQWRVYTLSLRDRFGDLGLVGAAMIREDNQAWELDTFLMSCRALGRRVEDAFASHLVAVAAGTGKPLRGVFVPTKKNTPMREMLQRHAWLAEDSLVAPSALAIPAWLRVITSGSS